MTSASTAFEEKIYSGSLCLTIKSDAKFSWRDKKKWHFWVLKRFEREIFLFFLNWLFFFNLHGLRTDNSISHLTLICLFLDIFQIYFRNFGIWNRFIRIVWKNIWLRHTLRSAYINNRWTEKAQRSFNKTWNSPLDNQIVLIFCTN